MYSGTTLTRYSGRIIGAHQKIDRVARRQLQAILPTDAEFPSIKTILLFEGLNGPDGIKRKSPAVDEPWHYINPDNNQDTQLLHIIEGHYTRLVNELKAKNMERAAFEAAWLAHAVVDGLTPAHHFPYEETLIELRGGKSIETRTTLKEKLLMHGETPLEKIRNNWRMWGSKGLMTTHGLFEIGFATLIAPMKFKQIVPTQTVLRTATTDGPIKTFKKTLDHIASMKLYETYYDTAWTPKYAQQMRSVLAPAIIEAVIIIWYLAAKEAIEKT